MGKIGNWLYRDADNYKFPFQAEVPEGVNVGDEIDYHDLGYDTHTFHSEIIGYRYDEDSDHNIVTLLDIENDKT